MRDGKVSLAGLVSRKTFQGLVRIVEGFCSAMEAIAGDSGSSRVCGVVGGRKGKIKRVNILRYLQSLGSQHLRSIGLPEMRAERSCGGGDACLKG
jgi:hypothetical protein